MAGVTLKKRNDVTEVQDYDVVTITNRGQRNFVTAEGIVEAGKSYEVSGELAKTLANYDGEIEVVHVTKGEKPKNKPKAKQTTIDPEAEKNALDQKARDLAAKEIELANREKALEEKEKAKPAPKEKAKPALKEDEIEKKTGDK